MNAAAVESILGQHVMVLHTSETGDEVRDIEQASHMTGMYEAVASYRPVIRSASHSVLG